MEKPVSIGRCEWATCAFVFFTLIFAFGGSLRASGQEAVLRTPRVRIPLDIKDQPITVTASAALTGISKTRDLWVFNLQLTGDFSELQRNLTGILSSQMNKDDRCGERLTIRNATLTPIEPASLAVIQLHYERWACAKLIGAKRLAGGDAEVQVKFTPAIDVNSTELHLIPEIGDIRANGSLGQLLRAGPLGGMIREKLHNALLSAMQKGTSLSATLPPAIQNYATLESADFKDGGSGNLLMVMDGQVCITQEQARLLMKEVKHFALR
jgi:hypothetical protein